MDVTFESLRGGGIKVEIHSDNDNDRALLGLLVRRGPPDDFECDPIGGETKEANTATMIWK